MKKNIYKSILIIFIATFLVSKIFNISVAASNIFDVDLNNKLASINAENISLEKILIEFANETGIQINIYGDFNKKITLKRKKSEFKEILIDLVRNKANYAFIYNRNSLKSVNIFKDSSKGYAKISFIPKTIKKLPLSPKKLYSKQNKKSKNKILNLLKSKNNLSILQGINELVINNDSKTSINYLNEILKTSQDSNLRNIAANTMAELKDKKLACKNLENIILNDNDPVVRESALDALAQIGGKNIDQILNKALNDESKDVRENAQRAIEELEKIIN